MNFATELADYEALPDHNGALPYYCDALEGAVAGDLPSIRALMMTERMRELAHDSREVGILLSENADLSACADLGRLLFATTDTAREAAQSALFRALEKIVRGKVDRIDEREAALWFGQWLADKRANDEPVDAEYHFSLDAFQRAAA